MIKRVTILQFILISILAAILVVMAIVPFNLPFSNLKLRWNSFWGGTVKGQDINESVYIEYETKLPNDEEDAEKLSKETDKMVNALYDILVKRGYNEPKVFKQTSGIRVELPYDIASESVLAILGDPNEILISGKSDYEEAMKDVNRVSGNLIKSATGVYTGSAYGVELKFNKEGTKAFKTLTANIAIGEQTLYIYANGKEFNNGNNSITGISEEIKDGTLIISGGMSSMDAAQNYALKITSGTLPVLLSVKKQDKFLTKNTSNINIVSSIIFISLFVLLLIFVIVKYRAFGLVAALGMLFYLAINLFLYNTVPFITFTLASYIGFLIATLMAINNVVVTNEQIRKEIAMGKKLPTAVNQGFKKSLPGLVLANVLVTVLSFITIWFTSGVVSSLIQSLFISSIVSGLTSLLLIRGLMLLALRINSNNYKAYGFKKSAVREVANV